MFKKFRDRLNEGVEEVKRDPRFQSSLASVTQLTAGLNKSESAEALAGESPDNNGGSHSTFNSSDLPMMTNNDHLFSMGDEDETGGGGGNAASTHLTNPGFESVDLTLPAGAQGTVNEGTQNNLKVYWKLSLTE